MKLTTLMLLLVFWTTLTSQNLSGDFTANDFLNRKSTKLKHTLTTIDTVTKKQKTKTTLIAIYNPKTKIITIQDVKTKHKFFFITDLKNELHAVNENGQEDTITFLPCRLIQINDTTFKKCDIISIYNKKGQLVKTITDTNSTSAMSFTENSYLYSGDTLKYSISKRFIFYPKSSVNKYFPDEPEEVTETFFQGNQKISTTKVLNRPSKTITTYKTVTEISPKTIISKTYYRDKLTSVGTYVFE